LSALGAAGTKQVALDSSQFTSVVFAAPVAAPIAALTNTVWIGGTKISSLLTGAFDGASNTIYLQHGNANSQANSLPGALGFLDVTGLPGSSNTLDYDTGDGPLVNTLGDATNFLQTPQLVALPSWGLS
jgi:hypothetical protein